MKQITANNYQDHTPGDLMDLLGGNQAQVIEESISGLITIGTYIAQAIATGPRIKRIQALEQFQLFQNKVNLKVAQVLETIQTKIDTIP